MGEKPLFIPLKTEHFEAFERGEKTVERRLYGPRWNERTCRLGRRVTLSCGYGKARRLNGVVIWFTASARCFEPSFSEIYEEGHGMVANIGVSLDDS